MKVLVLGTSHVGAFLHAREAIAADFPALDVDYFGLSGEVFSRARTIDGVFGPEKEDDRQFEWNPARTVDIRPYDHILLTGTRFMWQAVMRLLAQYDVLEEPERRDNTVMSRAAMAAMIDGAAELSCAQLNDRMPLDARVTALPAPYPLVRSWQLGYGHEPLVTAAAALSSAAAWTAHYEAAIARHLAPYGVRFMAQPMDTRHDALRSDNRFALAGSSAQEAGPRADNRHLNADYGRVAFTRYAEDILGLTRAAAQKDLDAAQGSQ